MTKLKRKKLVHMLITLPLGPVNLHAYVICPKTNQQEVTAGVANRMMNECEKKGVRVRIPMFAATTLDTGVEIVQEILREMFPEDLATNNWNPKEFHLTLWGSPADGKHDKKLMALH